MAVLHVIIFLASVIFCDSAIYPESAQLSQFYKYRIDIVRVLLHKECPSYKEPPSPKLVTVNDQKRFYKILETALHKCTVLVNSTQQITISDITMKTTPTAVKTTTPSPTSKIVSSTTQSTRLKPTTSLPAGSNFVNIDEACRGAANYDQSWRLDHNGKNILGETTHSHGGYACDVYDGSPWFRITGAAGLCYNKMEIYGSFMHVY